MAETLKCRKERSVYEMFIDANDTKWTLDKIEALSHTKPLSVCFMDEYGNSFLKRVKECIGKTVLLSLGIPFECFVEENKKNPIKRNGFLLVNDFVGMMYGYGFLEKLKDDLIPLLQKKDLSFFNKKGIFCFLDYGTVYIEINKNIWLPKDEMKKRMNMDVLTKHSKNSKRFLYDFHHRRPIEREEEKESWHIQLFQGKYSQLKEVLQKEKISYKETKKEGMTCGIQLEIKKENWLKALKKIEHTMYFKKVAYQTEMNEVWVMEKVPVYTEENEIYLEDWQCEWLHIPYVVIKKTP